MMKSQKTKIRQLWHIMLLFTAFAPQMLWAQNSAVSGVVSDVDGPVIGASVVEKGNPSNGVATDVDGRYTLRVAPNATLTVSYLGYATQDVAVSGRTTIDVVLLDDTQSLDEVVVVGYGMQKKVTLTGAVAGIKGSEMVQTKNENPQNMLTGMIAGVRVWQKSAEPGTFNNNFDIRGLGAPLMVIDGIPRSTGEFQRLNANDIEDISVLKDASAANYRWLPMHL